MVDRAMQLKDLDIFQIVMDITNNLIDSGVAYIEMIGDIVGTNGTKTHGGLIESLIKNNHVDMAKDSCLLVKQLIFIVNERPVKPEIIKLLGWEKQYLEESLEEYPFLKE